MGISGLLTSPSCESCSERFASVTEQLVARGCGSAEETLIINMQGDQTFVESAVIDAIAAEFACRTPTTEVLTPVYRMTTGNVHNPNVVKMLLAVDGRALYFSSSAIPHVRGVNPADWHADTTYWGHVGTCGYR